jgi:hypothetical protein
MAEPEKIEEKTIRIIWEEKPDNLPSFYANHLQISSGGETEFHITFGHLSPPLTFGLEEHELPDQILIKPILEIIASPEVMRKFVDVFSAGLKMFEDRQAQKERKNE